MATGYKAPMSLENEGLVTISASCSPVFDGAQTCQWTVNLQQFVKFIGTEVLCLSLSFIESAAFLRASLQTLLHGFQSLDEL